jgi:hypothetical protein
MKLEVTYSFSKLLVFTTDRSAFLKAFCSIVARLILLKFVWIEKLYSDSVEQSTIELQSLNKNA